jgi:hypothetical protein
MTGARPGSDAVDGGHRPHPNSLPCAACGHVWFAGERRHEYVERSDAGGGDADVLCVLCRAQRMRTRDGP